MKIFMVLRWLLLGALMLTSTMVSAQQYSSREMKRDLVKLQEDVFAPIAAQFEARAEPAFWREYIKETLDRIGALEDGLVSPITHGIYRDATLTMAQDFTEYKPDASWTDAAYHMDATMDLIARVIAYMEN